MRKEVDRLSIHRPLQQCWTIMICCRSRSNNAQQWWCIYILYYMYFYYLTWLPSFFPTSEFSLIVLCVILMSPPPTVLRSTYDWPRFWSTHISSYSSFCAIIIVVVVANINISIKNLISSYIVSIVHKWNKASIKNNLYVLICINMDIFLTKRYECGHADW